VVIVYAIIDGRSSADHPPGDAVETFVRREDAERFIDEVRGDGPGLAAKLRIEERGLEAGGRAELAAYAAHVRRMGRVAPERVVRPVVELLGHEN
jgi:hypothetical protein